MSFGSVFYLHLFGETEKKIYLRASFFINRSFMTGLLKTYLSCFFAFLCNLAMAYVVYMLCRFVYIAVNWDTFAEPLQRLDWGQLMTGAWYFDSSAIFYTLSLYLLLMLIPMHLKEGRRYQLVTKYIYLVVMTIAIIANLCDAVYFPYTGRRSTFSIFSEFSNDSNVGGIVANEALNHWYLVVIALLMLYGMYKLYVMPRLGTERPNPHRLRPSGFRLHGKADYLRYYVPQTIIFLGMIYVTVIAMRGGAAENLRPITLSNANQYVDHPGEAAMVLNTPFALIRSSSHKSFVDPQYYDEKTLDELYTPIVAHTPHAESDSVQFRPKNIVIFILESMGREYIGAFNDTLEGGKYKGYTPFLDELISESLTYEYSFCNGRKSIDAMPSILSSIPMFVEPYFVSSTALNEVGGIAECLNKKGYHTSFVHGADNGSMGFEAFARSTRFQTYLGRDEYGSSYPEFDGDRDFDGVWAIWDQLFMRYWLKELNKDQEPFLSTIFTATSHNPFQIPENYRSQFPEEELPIHKCIRYVDMALREFFDNARKQPWFENTIFVLCGDHTNQTNHASYQTDLGYFSSPIIFYDPSGEMPRGRRKAVAQQIDVMPTLLEWLHYDEPYLAFGKDLMNTPDSLSWAVNYYNDVYQMVKDDLLLQFDGEKTTAIYNIRDDWHLRNNLLQSPTAEIDSIRQDYETWYMAMIQSYMQRMIANDLKVYQDIANSL